MKRGHRRSTSLIEILFYVVSLARFTRLATQMRCPTRKASAPTAKKIELCLSKSKKISPSEPQKSAQMIVLI